jgi:hypothetical protein
VGNLYGAVSPKDGTCVYLILPAPDTECFQVFLETLAKKYSSQLILLWAATVHALTRRLAPALSGTDCRTAEAK